MKYALAGAIALVSCLIAPMALAAADTTSVSIPIGDWLQQAANIALPLAGTVLAATMAFLPAPIGAFVKSKMVDQLLQNALSYGFNAVASAEKGKTLSIDTGNAVVASAAQYAIDHGAAWVLAWAAGKDPAKRDPILKQKLLARVTLDANSAILSSDGPRVVKAVTAPAPMAPPPAKND